MTASVSSNTNLASLIRPDLELAYEAAWQAADNGLIDFSLIGEPLARALARVGVEVEP